MSRFLDHAEVYDDDTSDFIGWGFVLYRQDYSDDSKWETALQRLTEYATALAVYCTRAEEDSPAIREKARVLYKMPVFEDRENFVDENEISKHFLEWRESGVSFSRPRFLAFPVADAESVESIAELPELSKNTVLALEATIEAVDPEWDSAEQEKLRAEGPRPGFGRGESAARSDEKMMRVRITNIGRLWSALNARDFEGQVF